MAQWIDVWRIVAPASRKAQYQQPTINLDDGMNLNTAGYASFSTVAWFSNLLKGATARLQRYKQYDAMDYGDISRAMDIIAEEISNGDKRSGLPFIIDYQTEENQNVPDTTVTTLRAALRHWSKFHTLNKRVYNVARTMTKYGDCFFRKTSDTKKWEYVDPTRVIGIEIDQEGNKVAYHIRPSSFLNSVQSARKSNNGQSATAESVEITPATAMVHFTLSDDMGESAPFGLSILQNAFKDFQKLTMLEDSAIIYRIVRAPERRVFYIDVGNMPPQRVKQYIEQIRNDIRQKRMPNTANANQTDSQYNAECLALDTKIPLLDGRTLALTEIIAEHEAGKQNWVYSCDPVTGEFAPGEIEWAGVTRKNTEVLRLTLDNGETITCTPDHKFPIRGKGFVEAQDILIGEDSLFPHHTRLEPLAKKNEYQQILKNIDGEWEWEWTHRLISKWKDRVGLDNIMCHKFNGLNEKCTTVHHADFNRFNNNPENLMRMENKDHYRYHADNMREVFQHWKKTDTVGYAEWNAQKIERAKAWSKDPAIIASRIKHGKENPNVLENHSKKFSQGVHDRLVQLASQSAWKQKKTLEACKDDAMIIQRVEESNPKVENKICLSKADSFDCGFSDRFCAAFGYAGWKEFARKNNPDHKESAYFSKVEVNPELVGKIMSLAQTADSAGELQMSMLTKIKECETKTGAYKMLAGAYMAAGTSSWKEFKEKAKLYNHKVVKIERLTELQDTGCLTVGEKFHKWHTFAVGSGVYVRNSIQEDYFFPTTAAGRGSRVETLPGGATWEIPELDYFLKKVFRALRVPTSYMKGQDTENPGAVFNDGKMGVAYMEERVFANFIIRLQACVESTFDEQFKTYLEVTGINVDPELFRLKLPEPQNFALYRQSALNTDLVTTFKAIEETPYLSKRFMLEFYLGLTKDQIQMNEVLIKQEHGITTDLAVEEVQQIYDPVVYENRDKIKVEGEPEDTGGGDFGGGDIGAGGAPAEAPETPEEPAPDDAGGEEEELPPQ